MFSIWHHLAQPNIDWATWKTVWTIRTSWKTENWQRSEWGPTATCDQVTGHTGWWGSHQAERERERKNERDREREISAPYLFFWCEPWLMLDWALTILCTRRKEGSQLDKTSIICSLRQEVREGEREGERYLLPTSCIQMSLSFYQPRHDLLPRRAQMSNSKSKPDDSIKLKSTHEIQNMKFRT